MLRWKEFAQLRTTIPSLPCTCWGHMTCSHQLSMTGSDVCCFWTKAFNTHVSTCGLSTLEPLLLVGYVGLREWGQGVTLMEGPWRLNDHVEGSHLQTRSPWQVCEQEITGWGLFVTAAWSALNNTEKSLQGRANGVAGQRWFPKSVHTYSFTLLFTTRLGS